MTREASRHDRTALERLAALLGLVLLASMLAFMLWTAHAENAGPPELSAAPAATERAGAHWRVAVALRNDGPTTAAGVRVRGTLSTPGAPEETSTVELDYLPQHSEVEAALLFTRDPGDGTLALRIEGYTLP